MSKISTLPYPTRRHNRTIHRSDLFHASLVTEAPRKSTLMRLKQFARAYCPLPLSNENLSGIILN